jgi:hypothetical protein
MVHILMIQFGRGPNSNNVLVKKFVGVPTAAVVCLDDRPIGMLSGYFEDGALGKWLEAGDCYL